MKNRNAILNIITKYIKQMIYKMDIESKNSNDENELITNVKYNCKNIIRHYNTFYIFILY